MEPHIKELIYRKLTVGLTPQEEDRLAHWAAQSPANGERYRRLMGDTHFVERYEQYARIDEEKAFQQFRVRHGLSRPRRQTHLWRYAAILLLPLLLAAGLWLYHSEEPVPLSEETVALIRQSEQCGKSQATLIVPGGKEVTLQQESLASYQGEKYQTKTPHPVGVADSTQQTVAVNSVHTLKTHADSEYWITLEDGTTVHLNYNTTLVYPVHFSAHRRTVYLEGEAYFSVKAEPDRPFRVVTPHGVVTEYGTSFNVNTFAPHCTKVVLVEGSISVTPTEGAEQQMVPGELAMLSASQVEIEKVDIEPYIAWNKGRFVFENCPLEELMTVLSNWYGVEVEFLSASCRQMRFTGDVNRYGSLGPVLQAIRKATSLEIKMNGNTITIEECN